MGYFSNGTEGDIYEAEHCEKCVHWKHDQQTDTWGCPVMDAHTLHNYEQTENKALESVLGRLIPRGERGNLKCSMFINAEEVKRIRRARQDAKQLQLPT